MADQARTATRALDLARELEREPYRFSFFQALRRLEAEHKDRPRLGESTRAAEDPIRLGQKPSMAFAPSTLTAFERGKEGRPDRLDVLFFGLFALIPALFGSTSVVVIIFERSTPLIFPLLNAAGCVLFEDTRGAFFALCLSLHFSGSALISFLRSSRDVLILFETIMLLIVYLLSPFVAVVI